MQIAYLMISTIDLVPVPPPPKNTYIRMRMQMYYALLIIGLVLLFIGFFGLFLCARIKNLLFSIHLKLFCH